MEHYIEERHSTARQRSYMYATGSGTSSKERASRSRLENKRALQRDPKQKPPLYSFVALIVCILLIIYIIGAQLSKPERIVQRLEEAVANEDYKYIADVMNDAQDELTATEEDAKAFVSYLTRDQAGYEQILKDLHASYLDGPSYINKAVKPFISLKQNGRTWLFFDRYELQMETYKAYLSTNFENVDLYIGSKKIDTIQSANDTAVTSSLFPGIYTFKAVPNKAYGTIETVEKVDVTKSIQNKVQVYLELEGQYIYPSSNEENAHLFVNGQDTGLKIGEINGFGPVKTDGSVTVYAEKKTKSGVKQSRKVKVEEETDLYLPLK